jgi:GTP cyclohydrolase IV
VRTADLDRLARRDAGGGGVALSRVGVRELERVIRIGVDGRSAQPFATRLECLVEPGPEALAAPVERAVAEALADVGRDDAGIRAERLAQRVAERVRASCAAQRAIVTLAARFPERRPAPVSGVATQEISTLHAGAAASVRRTRRSIGVSVQGMTVSPHAQSVLIARARERLAGVGFTPAAIERILDQFPVATHDQIGIGTLHVGVAAQSGAELDAAVLIDILKAAMSSEIFELMKRSDEAAVVERAHGRPRYAEDCVHAMIGGVLERFPGLPDDVFVLAAQENVETVRGHHLVAERAGLLGDLRRAPGGAPARPSSLGEWLAAV